VKSARTASRRYGGKTAHERQNERRATLVGAALEIWQEQGWAAVTMRGVCARAGLTDRYFYENFRNRDDLLTTVWDQIRDDTLRTLLHVVTTHADLPPLEQLRATLHVLVHHSQEDPAGAQILYGDHAGSAVLEQRRRQSIQQATDLFIQVARPYLRTGIDEKALRVNVLLGIGGFVEIMLAWRSGQLDTTADALVDHLAEISTALAGGFLEA
jgi:AcrR family transcriptional regulator